MHIFVHLLFIEQIHCTVYSVGKHGEKVGGVHRVEMTKVIQK